MRNTLQMTSLLVGVVLLSAMSMPTWAVDGVILIDQNKALAGGVTPGDAPGFPVTISLPGSYRLAGNLTVPDANTDAVVITASNVTLDLNGFRIRGAGLAGTGKGVRSDFSNNITVLNGVIFGMGSHGIALGGSSAGTGNHLIEKVSSDLNGGDGIHIAYGRIVNSSASGNGGDGISAVGGTISNVTVDTNNNGVNALAGVIVSFSSMSFNQGYGLTGGSSLNNTFDFNFTGTSLNAVKLGPSACNGSVCP